MIKYCSTINFVIAAEWQELWGCNYKKLSWLVDKPSWLFWPWQLQSLLKSLFLREISAS